MRERFYWGDMDGNNGYIFDKLTRTELQAAWEIGPDLTFLNSNRAVLGEEAVRVWLDHEGKPCLTQIPRKEDAERIKSAIHQRALVIRSSEKVSPPTIEQIRERILGRVVNKSL